MLDDKTLRLIFMIVLGAGMALYFFDHFRKESGKTLQMILIWVLIFAGVLALYSWKDRITSVLFPQKATVNSEGNIVVQRGMDGHFKINIDVNGQSMPFLIDTGASSIALTIIDAAKLNILPPLSAFTQTAQTANGITKQALVFLDEVRIGNKTFYDVRAYVNKGPLSISLLGMSFLNEFSKVEIERDRLTLHP